MLLRSAEGAEAAGCPWVPSARGGGESGLGRGTVKTVAVAARGIALRIKSCKYPCITILE